MTRRPVLFAGLVAPAFFLVVAAGPAAAQTAEAGLRSWVAAIDASPAWAASFDSIQADPTGKNAVITGLVIKPETDNSLTLRFEPIRVTGYAQPAGGGFSADEVSLPGATVDAPGLGLKIGAVKLTGLSVPNFDGIVFDKDKPFTSIIRAYSLAAKAKLTQGTVDRVDFKQTIKDQTSGFGYSNITISKLGDGKIDSMGVGPMVIDAPSQEGLVRMTVERVEEQQIDLNGMIQVFDPDLYVGGVGDGKWRSVVGLVTYRNIAMQLPTGQATIASMTGEDFRVRQPPKSFAPFFDAIIAHPDMDKDESGRLASEYALNLLWAMGFGRMSIDGIDLSSPGLDRFQIGQFYMRDFSADGLGELSLSDLGISVSGEGSLDLGRFVLGDISFPKLSSWQNLSTQLVQGADPDVSPLIPHLGFLEFRDVALDLAQEGSAALERLRLDLGGYVGAIPTAIDLDFRGLSMDADSVKDPDARKFLSDFGYDRIVAEHGFRIRWEEATQNLAISDFRIGLKDMGKISADVQIKGLTRPMLEHPKDLEAALPSLLFTGAHFTVEDQSLFDRFVGFMAKKSNITPDAYRAQIAGAMPFFLLMLKNPDFQSKLAPALQAFVKVPGKLALVARPMMPVPIGTLMTTAEKNPERLPNLLSIDVSTGP